MSLGLTQSFPVCHGVKQVSILSPTIFVIDSLLRALNATYQGLSYLGLDVGSSAHADDIHLVNNSADAVSKVRFLCKL